MAVVAAIFALRYDLSAFLVTPPHEEKQTPRPKPVAKRQLESLPFDVASSAPSSGPPLGTTFDVVRIDPDGASVFAGRAPANATVSITANEQAVAAAKANESGEWAVAVERPFAAGDYQLSLTAKPDGAGAQEAGQSVRITVPAGQRPRVASTEPASAAASAMPPRPITFVYDQASFTPEGMAAAARLLVFLKARNAANVTLSGHADERGTDLYNMQLSQQRLDTVANYLRKSGFAGKLVLLPKGKTEPYAGIDRATLPLERVYQLDRRVELRLAH